MNAELHSLLALLGFALAAVTPSRAAAAITADTATSVETERHTVRVRVFKVAGGDPLFARLVAELRAQGFEVAEEPEQLPASGDGAEAVEARVRDAVKGPGSADAALAVSSTPLVIRVWIANAATGRQLFREVQREQNTLPDTAIVALWAVELLRATGFAGDLRQPAAAPQPPVPPAPPKRPSTLAPPASPPEAETLTLHVGPAVLVSPGGLSPAYAIALGAHWQAGRVVGLETEWLLPLANQDLQRAQGGALVSMALGTLGAFVALGRREAGWSGQLGGGVAVARLSATGTDAERPFAARTDYAFAAGPYLRAGLVRRLTSRFGVRFDLSSGAALPRPVIAFGDAAIAHWGQPWVSARLAVEAAF